MFEVCDRSRLGSLVLCRTSPRLGGSPDHGDVLERAGASARPVPLRSEAPRKRDPVTKGGLPRLESPKPHLGPPPKHILTTDVLRPIHVVRIHTIKSPGVKNFYGLPLRSGGKSPLRHKNLLWPNPHNSRFILCRLKGVAFSARREKRCRQWQRQEWQTAHLRQIFDFPEGDGGTDLHVLTSR